MMQDEQERLETTLRQISPAAPPQELMDRLRLAALEAQPSTQPAVPGFRWTDLFRGWRTLTVAAPAAAVILLWLAFRPAPKPSPMHLDATGIKANAVQVGHSLVASFDTVAQLPGGEPVRFRCREWEDNVVIHDAAHGLVISKTVPRVEMVPVRFETY